MAESLEISFDTSEVDDVDSPEYVSENVDGTVTVDESKLDEEKDEKPANGERPEWLPEQFKTPEDLAKSYNELRKKLSGGKKGDDEEEGEPSLSLNRPKEEKPVEEEPKDEPTEKLDFAALTREYMEKGALTEETLSALDKAGISQDFIGSALQGVKTTVAQVRKGVAEVVGGEEALKDVLDWGRDNLSDSEKNLFDQAMSSGNEAAAKMAMRGLYAQYTESNGSEPELIEGQGQPRSDGVKGFADMEEYVEAMQDPRYDTSSAYRRKVDARLEASDW